MVRDSNSGHQLLLLPANWCPIFAYWTTQAPALAAAAPAPAVKGVSADFFKVDAGGGGVEIEAAAAAGADPPSSAL